MPSAVLGTANFVVNQRSKLSALMSFQANGRASQSTNKRIINKDQSAIKTKQSKGDRGVWGAL